MSIKSQGAMHTFGSGIASCDSVDKIGLKTTDQ